jgi:hypothetical protein
MSQIKVMILLKSVEESSLAYSYWGWELLSVREVPWLAAE